MVVIIGSGPSLKNKKQGKDIDSCEHVIRFPYAVDWQDPIDYGTKTSFHCCTAKRAKHLQLPLKNGCYMWSKYGNIRVSKELSERIGAKDMTRLIRSWQKQLPKTAYPFFSVGTAAICIAASELKEKIVVLGCDMLRVGVSDPKQYFGSWVHEGREQKIVHHSLGAERKLIDKMSKEYNVEIIWPNYQS